MNQQSSNEKREETQIRVEKKKKMVSSSLDKMFEIPLLISICMLAMAHGSNEINVAAPLAA